MLCVFRLFFVLLHPINCQGVEVQKPVKGLYIQNGKKVLVK